MPQLWKRKSMLTQSSSPQPIEKLILGTMQFGWTADEIESTKILNRFYELGGRRIDTANIYGDGRSEVFIGNWMKRRSNRDKVTLITKVGAGKEGGLGKKQIIKACNESLKRLKTGYIDVYIAHLPDKDTPVSETVEVFKLLTKEGKVREVGCSNYTAAELEDFISEANTQGISLKYVEANYNYLERKTVEEHLLPTLKKHNIRLFSYGSLCGGLLVDNYKKEIKKNQRRKFLKEKTLTYGDLLIQIEKESKEKDTTISQEALGWLISKKYINGVIFGVDNHRQLSQNIPF